MKKFLFISLILAAIIYFFVFKNSHCQNNKTKKYFINNKNYCLLTASTLEQWQKGLMFYKSKSELKGADGMIFIFPDKQIKSFWNMNTYLDLNIYWMDGETIVGKSYLPSILKSKNVVTVNSKEKVDRVVEIIK